ncbi:MAG: hypothetical protein M1294_14240 [Firmicutes bacterium]|jgi:hypothetical protein|uniref:Uncharacterized protein n=1 Tax=Sulfobacillus benefaciens TaxID=453960 RepID=A0A2T2WV53_9FIRM|nr:hypothetical protein [Bacillota bacterium]MCL5012695.1 hypothetical protein [Bacillota bacterium]PSR26103.1 MAG: hypothetical protein C7B43_14930 [Sulfobacillus benefaciens]HBQ95888.1 hypothetical protein [Sulfobacillus sp.]
MKFGTWMSIITFVGGIWVILSPTIVGVIPRHGNPWTNVVLGTEILGLAICLFSLLGVMGFWAIRLKWLSSQKFDPPKPNS